MPKKRYLRAGVGHLSPVRVASRLCIFPSTRYRPDSKIRKIFQDIREYVVEYGLDPDTLLHIGIQTLEQDQLVSYECCLEYPLPIESENEMITIKTLPGGRYAILRINKNPREIGQAIQQLYGDFIPDNQLVIDEMRPTYEIYYEDHLAYCVPVYN